MDDLLVWIDPQHSPAWAIQCLVLALSEGALDAPVVRHRPAIEGFDAFLQCVDDEIERRLIRHLSARERRANRLGPDVQAMHRAVADLTMGRKARLRSALVLAAHRACGGRATDETATLEAGAAVELLQTYMQIHNDWMHRNETCQGAPSAHTGLARHHGQVALGEASAILAGDYACAMAQETLAALPVEATTVIDLMVCFARMQQDLVFSDHLDLVRSQRPVQLARSTNSIRSIVRGPLHMGAILAGASAAQMAALEQFAVSFGAALRIRDTWFGASLSVDKSLEHSANIERLVDLVGQCLVSLQDPALCLDGKELLLDAARSMLPPTTRMAE